MKIVLIGPVPPYRGGIAHFTQALAENLARQGHSVRTISFSKQYPRWLYPGKSDKDYSQAKLLENVEFLFSPLNYWDWKKTLREIKNFQPDLVIYPWWVTFWTPATAWMLRQLRKLGIVTSVLVHNAFPHEGGRLDRMLTKFALKDARYFVTMSEKETERLKTVVHKDSIIETSAHPVFAQFPISGLSKEAIREKLALPTQPPLTFFFGFVRPYKGLGVLLEAMGRLKQDHVDIHLVVAGEFWQDRNDYEKQINTLGISDMVTLRAEYIPDSEAGLYFEAADIFVAPYLDGTQSGSIKIAMGYHLPVIVTDVITDPLILNHQHGLSVVRTGDAALLAENLKTMSVSKYVTNPVTLTLTQDSWMPLLEALFRR